MSFIERVFCFIYLPYLSSEVKEKRFVEMNVLVGEDMKCAACTSCSQRLKPKFIKL